MNLFKSAVKTVSSVFPLTLLQRFSGVDLLLPYHHLVSDEALPHVDQLYAYKNKKQFIRDLDWLLKNYKPVSAEEVAIAFAGGRALPPRSFLLSFDDGFREVHDTIAPILLQKGVPALFFINPAFIDNRELFYRCKLSLVLHQLKKNPALLPKLPEKIAGRSSSFQAVRKAVLSIRYPQRQLADELGTRCEIDFGRFLKEQKPFLTREQMEDLSHKGFAFGGHSWDHPYYHDLTPEEQVGQTISSLGFVDAFQKNRPPYFAFPHEDKSILQAFFDSMRTVLPEILFFGLQNEKIEGANRVLHRFNAENPQEPLSTLAKTLLAYHIFLKWSGRQQVSRK